MPVTRTVTLHSTRQKNSDKRNLFLCWRHALFREKARQIGYLDESFRVAKSLAQRLKPSVQQSLCMAKRWFAGRRQIRRLPSLIAVARDIGRAAERLLFAAFRHFRLTCIHDHKFLDSTNRVNVWGGTHDLYYKLQRTSLRTFGAMDDFPISEELALVILAQQGDPEAFRALVERYDRRLLYFIRRILDDSEDAFDALQEVWLTVHRSLRKLQAPRAFRVWLFRIAHDQSITQLRRRRKWVSLDESTLADPPADSLPDAVFDTAEIVHKGMKQLSVDHRRVLTLRFLENMSVDEIASVLSCNPGTVKSRLHYAKESLRRWIKEENHE